MDHTKIKEGNEYFVLKDSYLVKMKYLDHTTPTGAGMRFFVCRMNDGKKDYKTQICNVFETEAEGVESFIRRHPNKDSFLTAKDAENLSNSSAVNINSIQDYVSDIFKEIRSSAEIGMKSIEITIRFSNLFDVKKYFESFGYNVEETSPITVTISWK